jgi:myo-inositol-1(or 4)-monophosphatase
MSDVAMYLPELERIAAQAADLILSGYRRGAAVSKKGRIDLVTEYDVAAEKLILSELGRTHPELTVIGEETHGKGARGPEDALVVYVDPIDGTTNFAHGHPFFCVSLGLCRGSEPLLGVIVAPALGVRYQAVVGHGATRNGRPCQVSSEADLEGALCATGFSYDVVGTDDDNVREFQVIQAAVQGVRRCGSAALDLALVADGTYDAYWERGLQPWDMAAGAALVLAAGGKVSRYDGSAADVRVGTVLASNGPLHAELVRLLGEVRVERAGLSGS